MKVCLAGYQAISILHGGPNTQLRNTARHLPAFGIEPVFFDPWTRLTKGDCDIFHLFAANIGTYHLAREIRALGVPLVVSPIIYSLHSTGFIRTVLRLTRVAQRVGKGIWSDYALAADICGWASRVFANTQAEAHLVSKGLGVPVQRVTVIPNGVDERFYHADPSIFKKKYGLEDFILNVGHVGHERKNVLDLIKALGQINHPAVIIGRVIQGSYGDACMREAAKHKQIRVIEGLDNNSEMLASAYAACGTFVLPSLFETPGIAALEAALAGAKVVITKHGGTEEYFRGMATYVDPRSVDSIREGILHGLDSARNPALREHVKANFLWPQVAKKTAEAYQSLLAG